LTLTAAVAALGAVSAPAALAGTLTDAVTPCEGQTLSQTFLPWLDPANYVKAPDGGFEAGADGWQLSGGAAVADGNEPFRVGGAGDHQTLRLPPGASATSPAMCVKLLYPTLRAFARGDGSLLGGLLSSKLNVDVVYRDPAGQKRTAPVISVATPGTGWQLMPPAPILANLSSLAGQDGSALVSFRFTAAGGTWWVDDLYVDPFKAR
jgi:hypothetical protein